MTDARATTRTAPDHLPVQRQWITLPIVSMGLFLAVLSTTVVSVALPSIGRDLDATTTSLQWVVDAYVLVYASLQVIGGTLGDRRGRKGLFMIGGVVFATGSLACGVAPSIGLLIAGRVIQGLGPALLVPGSLTIIRATFTDDARRAAAIGLWSTSAGLGLAVGPPLGGLLVSMLGWRSVFLLNVPLAVGLAVAAGRYLPRLPPGRPGSRLDTVGAVLTTAALALITLAIIGGQHHAAASPLVLGASVAGLAALAGFVVWERHRTDPLIDLTLFSRPAFTAAAVAAFMVFFAFVGALIYLSAYFQQVQHHSAISAGLEVAPIGIALAVVAALTGRLVGVVGERWPMLAGLVLAGVATLGLLRFTPDTSAGGVWWNLALIGGAIGLCGTPTTTVAMSAVDTTRAGMASAVINTMRQTGQVFGVAVLGALVYAHLPHAGAGEPLSPAQGAAFVAGLHAAAWVAGLALLATAALAGGLFWLQGRRG